MVLHVGKTQFCADFVNDFGELDHNDADFDIRSGNGNGADRR